MQHKPYASSIVDSAIKGKLLAADFPSTVKGQDAPTATKPTNVIAFIIGGATFEEAADLSTTHNSERDCVILGGTSIHNSKSFIADIMSIQTLRAQPTKNVFEIEK